MRSISRSKPASASRSRTNGPDVAKLCPCGSTADETACCGPLLSGERKAATPEQLMRSRYTAYVRGAIDYLVATHATPSERSAIAARSKETTWRGLEIIAIERGGTGDTEGIVEFVARGEVGGVPFAQRERSRFRRVAGRWSYLDAVIPGRNDPCPCGSGQKFKRCHGAST